MLIVNRRYLTQLKPGESFLDGRPSFSPDGKKIIFERVPGNNAFAELWVIATGENSTESLFYKNQEYSCRRADWNLNKNNNREQIAFTANYSKAQSPESKIMLLDVNQKDKQATWLKINGLERAELSYPVWYPGTDNLMLANYTNNQLLKVSSQGDFICELTPDVFRTGMGCINPQEPDIIAFAGQPRTLEPYNQKINQIWIQLGESDPELFSSDSSGAIGRAPWFHPNGTYMVYEALGKTNTMQIFLKRIKTPYTKIEAVRVSDAQCYAQHAKFSPDGTQISWAEKTANNRCQIVIADVLD